MSVEGGFVGREKKGGERRRGKGKGGTTRSTSSRKSASMISTERWRRGGRRGMQSKEAGACSFGERGEGEKTTFLNREKEGGAIAGGMKKLDSASGWAQGGKATKRRRRYLF